MERRDYLKTVGSIAGAATIGSAGFFALTSGAAASTIDITGGSPSVSNDRGNLSKLTVNPQFTVNWDNFDDAVGKVFFLLEAKVGDGDFHPIYRATPWLGADEIGTTGSFTRPNSESGGLGPLVVADADGKPDYSSLSFPAEVDEQSFLDGTSIGGAGDYPSNGVVL